MCQKTASSRNETEAGRHTPRVEFILLMSFSVPLSFVQIFSYDFAAKIRFECMSTKDKRPLKSRKQISRLTTWFSRFLSSICIRNLNVRSGSRIRTTRGTRATRASWQSWPSWGLLQQLQMAA